MSFESKSAPVRGNQLKVQELCLTSEDRQILIDNGSDHIVIIGEPVKSVLLCIQKDDSTNALVHFAASSLSIVDSSAYTAGGDLKAIKITGLAAVDASDVVILKYILE